MYRLNYFPEQLATLVFVIDYTNGTKKLICWGLFSATLKRVFTAAGWFVWVFMLRKKHV